jgi:hypothetical protein
MSVKYLPSTTRSLPVLDRSWDSVVFQDGKPVLDSELNLSQDISKGVKYNTTASGVVSVYPREPSEFNFVFGETPNTFSIKSFSAYISGEEIVVTGSNSTTASNVITLPAPTVNGSPPDSKRTDFVFLEVWKQLVSPSSPATAMLRLMSNSMGDVYFDGTSNVGGGFVTLAVGVDFQIGATIPETARNIRDAINLQSTSNTLGLPIEAETNGTEFIFITIGGGASSNNVVITTAGDVNVKSPSGGTNGQGMPNPTSLYPNGNTQADPTLYLASDILDSFVAEETTKRVQIQYRFRVFSLDYNGEGQSHPDGINPKTQFYGFDNINVLAQGGKTVPQAGYYFSKANGTDIVRADGETNSYPFVDSGLFYCGDGTEESSTALGTVDGYVYAIPICYVFRRTQGAFDPEHYANNALLSTHTGTSNNALISDTIISVGAGISDRPDGQFSDLIYPQDILDLRTTVFPHGFDYASELVRQFQLLLDNRNETWAIDSSDFRPLANASGGISTKPIVCEEIGRSVANGGVGNTTQRGTYIRDFDHISRRFSNTPSLERVIFEIKYDVSQNYSGVLSVTKNGVNGWYDGDVISFDLTSLEASSKFRYWDAPSRPGLSFADCAPTGTYIIDVLECWHDDGNSASEIDTSVQIKRVSGLGTDSISIILDRNNTAINLGTTGTQIVGNTNDGDLGSDRSLFVTLLVEYPAKQGTSATPLSEAIQGDTTVYPTGPVLEYRRDQKQIDAFHVDRPPEIFYREGSREVGVELVGELITSEFISESVFGVRLPWRVHFSNGFEPTVTRLSDNFVIPLDLNSSKFGSSDTYLKFLTPIAQTALVEVASYPRMPVSNYGASGYQIACYYRSVSPQTCGSKATPTNADLSLEIQPIIISDKVWSITKGASSTEDAYPFLAPFEQIGVNPDLVFSEADLLGSCFISLEDFDVNTGLLNQNALVPMDQTDVFLFEGVQMDMGKRVVYRRVQSNSYMPSTYARKLGDNIRHKNATCLLGLVKASSSGHFNRGEVVLVVISRVSEALDTGISDPSRSNYVALLDSDDDTVACVYRTQGRVLNKQRKISTIDVQS